jgi:putative DNA primase/helicase
LRAMGKSVLLNHHSGKSGDQRGTSRREDVLDNVINLKRPKNYTPDKGAFFEVHFEKNRYLYGAEVIPFEAQLSTDSEGKQCWLTKSLELSTYDKVVSLTQEGLSQKEIADELDIHKATVSRHVKQAKFNGILLT